jgi:hypothetical protein
LARPFSYAEALRLLGSETSAVRRMDKILSGALLGAAVFGFPQTLALLGAKSEVVRLGHELLTGLRERLAGRSRYDRTRRIEAAHAVLVITAFFSAFGELDLPFRAKDLQLTRHDQVVAVAPRGPSERNYLLGSSWLETAVPLPAPNRPFERSLALIADRYREWAAGLGEFVAGLVVWDDLDETRKSDTQRLLGEDLPANAALLYKDLYRRLAVDVPEFAFWASMADQQATRAEVRDRAAELSTGLAGLERLLLQVTEGRVPDERLNELATRNRAALGRPVAEAGEAPAGLRLPTLAEAYMNPRFRFAEVSPSDDPSAEEWWEPRHVQPDAQGFLAGYMTASRATDAPLVVLGQPGSGKSVLTKVLAARLPEGDFLPVRVELRSVPADTTVQDQIEHAIRQATGERIDWPALARSARGALPVVFLDGFDELLQATGVRRSDYLSQVSEFQRRESELGRPVAMIVTSRIAVADRARFPEGSAALRLEPFNESQLRAWVQVWNLTNASAFAAGDGPGQLDPDLVLAHRDLASQPLLLLMLALYDADGNALRRAGTRIGQRELYEKLLARFARREILKHHQGLSDAETNAAVEREMLQLSVAAFAMFNRSRQWVTQDELNTDLSALLPDRQAAPSGFRAPLSPAEVTLGRFFFVHHGSATRDDTVLETYEFLHSTFGEYLVARFTFVALRDIAARQAAAAASPLGRGTVDDDLLYAVLSHAALTVRGAVIGFLGQFFRSLGDEDRKRLKQLTISLFRAMGDRTGPGRFPRSPAYSLVIRRHAHYGINLVLLALMTNGSLVASDLFTGEAAAAGWRDIALLWRAMCTAEEWLSLVDALAVERIWSDKNRDVQLTLAPGWHVPPVDLRWSYDQEPGRAVTRGQPPQNIDRSNRQAYFICSNEEDLRLHALEPIVGAARNALTTVHSAESGTITSAANGLLRLWMTSTTQASPGELQQIYEQLLGLVHRKGSINDASWNRFLLLLMDRLEHDARWLPARFVAEVLEDLLERTQNTGHRREIIARCALAALGHDRREDQRLLELAHRAGSSPETRVRIHVAYAETGLILDLQPADAQRLQEALDHVGKSNPALVRRLRLAMQETGGAGLLNWPDASTNVGT